MLRKLRNLIRKYELFPFQIKKLINGCFSYFLKSFSYSLFLFEDFLLIHCVNTNIESQILFNLIERMKFKLFIREMFYIFSTHFRPSILKNVSKTRAVASHNTNLLILTDFISPVCLSHANYNNNVPTVAIIPYLANF